MTADKQKPIPPFAQFLFVQQSYISQIKNGWTSGYYIILRRHAQLLLNNSGYTPVSKQME